MTVFQALKYSTPAKRTAQIGCLGEGSTAWRSPHCPGVSPIALPHSSRLSTGTKSCRHSPRPLTSGTMSTAEVLANCPSQGLLSKANIHSPPPVQLKSMYHMHSVFLIKPSKSPHNPLTHVWFLRVFEALLCIEST